MFWLNLLLLIWDEIKRDLLPVQINTVGSVRIT